MNGSQLHLNPKGTAYLATNFIRFIRGDNTKATTARRRDADFRISAPQQLHLLEDLLRLMSMQGHKARGSNMTCDDLTMGECDSILHCVTKLKGLKIASLNVDSLLKHIDEIRHLLFKFPFDIFAINESKIDDSITDGK